MQNSKTAVIKMIKNMLQEISFILQNSFVSTFLVTSDKIMQIGSAILRKYYYYLYFI